MTGEANVSVIVPTRDRPRLLAAALESLLAQTRPVEQILLIDDGSSPTNLAQVRELAARSATVELIEATSPAGPAAARNLGLAHAKGRYVAFLDDDDLIHPQFHEVAVDTLEAHPEIDVLAFGSECFFVPASLESELPLTLLYDCRSLAEHPLHSIDAGNPVPAATLASQPLSALLRYAIPVHSMLVRRDTIGALRFPEDLRQGEDTLFWLRLAAGGARFMRLPQIFAYVRRHGGNTTRSRRRYQREIQPCYQAVLDQRLLHDPQDIFLVHLKLLCFRARSGSPGWWRHLLRVMSKPRLLLRETGFWWRNLQQRRRLLRYYFHP
jgi:glycosyltransferase involved in cell wall biosynthesis